MAACRAFAVFRSSCRAAATTTAAIAPTAAGAATCERLGAAAAHAARAPVRRAAAGYDRAALARPGRRDSLLHLLADLGTALAARHRRLRPVRRQHHRLDQLRRAT